MGANIIAAHIRMLLLEFYAIFIGKLMGINYGLRWIKFIKTVQPLHRHITGTETMKHFTPFEVWVFCLESQAVFIGHSVFDILGHVKLII
jgi:hypothetical protein